MGRDRAEELMPVPCSAQHEEHPEFRGKHTFCSQCSRMPARDLGYPLFPG